MAEIKKYKKVSIDGCFNISPSGVMNFIVEPSSWYESHIAGNKQFTGNTSSVFGSILHAGIEQFWNDEILTTEDINEYLKDYEGSPVDAWYIHDFYEATISELIKKTMHLGKPDKQEYRTSYMVTEGYAVGGTTDYRRGTVLGDYKSSKTKKSSIGDYVWQLMTLAYIDRLNGLETTHIEITSIRVPQYEVKATEVSPKTGKLIGGKKAVEPEVNIITEEITDKMWQDIEAKLKLMVKTHKAYVKYPELKDVLFRPNETSFFINND